MDNMKCKALLDILIPISRFRIHIDRREDPLFIVMAQCGKGGVVQLSHLSD